MKTIESKQNTYIRPFIRVWGGLKIFGLIGALALMGCEVSVGPVADGDTESPEAAKVAPEKEDTKRGPDTEAKTDLPSTQHSCEFNNTCPSDLLNPIAPFEDESTWTFSFPNDLQSEDAWLNRSFFKRPAPETGYDLSSITEIRVVYGSYILIKSPHGDRLLSFMDHGPYWSGSNDYHVAQDNWLTLENARWTDTHTTTIDVCIQRIYDCIPLSITLEDN